jgi:hypothetical protein
MVCPCAPAIIEKARQYTREILEIIQILLKALIRFYSFYHGLRPDYGNPGTGAGLISFSALMLMKALSVPMAARSESMRINKDYSAKEKQHSGGFENCFCLHARPMRQPAAMQPLIKRDWHRMD